MGAPVNFFKPGQSPGETCRLFLAARLTNFAKIVPASAFIHNSETAEKPALN
jgi:hypothetical protein